jgi:hypothetical protein
MTKRGLHAYEEVEDPEVEDSLSPAHFKSLDSMARWWSLYQSWDSDKNEQNGYKIVAHAHGTLPGSHVGMPKVGEFRSASVAGAVEKALAWLAKENGD